MLKRDTLVGDGSTNVDSLLLQYIEDQIQKEGLSLKSLKRNQGHDTTERRTAEEVSERQVVIPVDSKHFYQNLVEPADRARVVGLQSKDLEPWDSSMRVNRGVNALSRLVKHGSKAKPLPNAGDTDVNPDVTVRTSSTSSSETEFTFDFDPTNLKIDSWKRQKSSDFSIPPAISDYSRLSHQVLTWKLEEFRQLEWHLRMSGFYYGRMGTMEAGRLLERFPVGTFLLRDSSDRRYLLSISVRTDRGSTSIRIACDGSRFRMDAEPDLCHLMPTFDCVLRMIEYYRRICIGLFHSKQRREGRCVFLESSANRNVRILLRTPLRLRPESLGHVCRKLIHACVSGSAIHRLPVSPSLKAFLLDYPYDI